MLKRGSRRGNEYAWPLSDIPDVIRAAAEANLMSLGGQLQFRLPAATCECYWVEVDVSKLMDGDLSWKERVVRSAEASQIDFEALRFKYDFLAEGRDSFGECLNEFEEHGGDLNEVMCFVWYVETEEGFAALKLPQIG